MDRFFQNLSNLDRNPDAKRMVAKRIAERLKEREEMMSEMSDKERFDFMHGDGIQTQMVGQQAKDFEEEWGNDILFKFLELKPSLNHFC